MAAQSGFIGIATTNNRRSCCRTYLWIGSDAGNKSDRFCSARLTESNLFAGYGTSTVRWEK